MNFITAEKSGQGDFSRPYLAAIEISLDQTLCFRIQTADADNIKY